MALVPTTQQVAPLVWWRTRAMLDTSVPGGTLVADFTTDTEPNQLVAQSIIQTTADGFADVTGPLDAAETAYPAELDALVRAAIAWQAAANIEATSPASDDQKVAWLQSRADALHASLMLAVREWRDTGATGEETASASYIEDPRPLMLPWSPLYGSLWGYPASETVLANRMLPAGVLPVGAYPWGVW